MAVPFFSNVSAFFFRCACYYFPLTCMYVVALQSPSSTRTSSASNTNVVSPKIAVIGSGAAGLVATRVLSRNGISPTVLEKDPYFCGGVWKYHPGSKTRPVYQGLRTNLPKEIMNYREFPWPPLSDKPQEDLSFVTHAQVLEYLETYQQHFDLGRFIQFGCTVNRLQVLEDRVSSVSPPNEAWPQIQLQWTQHQEFDNGTTPLASVPVHRSETFDAVLVCNGHYSKASIPSLDGANYFTGRTLHSIEYDNPQDFEGQRVLCIGARASGGKLRPKAMNIPLHCYCTYRDNACL